MVKVENLHIEFDTFQLNNISFKVEKGEYFMLLGASGAGKSVILEAIAGLVPIKSGNIMLNGKNINKLAIQKRKIGLVFQDFALFPHLSVKENICYPLKIAKTSKTLINNKLKSLASELNIEHLLDRKPETLSGGEKQRVALARTLTLEPEVLLLDEPLSAIDISLKADLRSILRRLNKKGQTIIHVTHDYEEAISLAQTVGIIHQGELIQTGSPQEVFTHPKNKFVANFGGVKNFYAATLIQERHVTKAQINNEVSFQVLTKFRSKQGFVLISQKNIIISKQSSQAANTNQFSGIIKEIIPARFGFEIAINCGITIYASITNENQEETNYVEGQKIWLQFNPSAVRYIPI